MINKFSQNNLKKYNNTTRWTGRAQREKVNGNISFLLLWQSESSDISFPLTESCPDAES
jgi:hypothetical protein